MKPRLKLLGVLSLFFVLASCSSGPSQKSDAPLRRAGNSEAGDDLDSGLDDSPTRVDLTSGGAPAAPSGVPTSGALPVVESFASNAKTRYQVIQEGFEVATIMPTVNDFDPLDDPSPHTTCYSVKAGDPNRVSEIVIRQMMVQIAGAADYGPLFPGTLDHVEPRLVIGKNNGWVNSQNLTNEMRQVFDLARAPGSLVIRINENKFGIYQDIGAPAEIWIRKDPRNRLFFKVYRLNAERVRTEVFIGYCFVKSHTPPVAQ